MNTPRRNALSVVVLAAVFAGATLPGLQPAGNTCVADGDQRRFKSPGGGRPCRGQRLRGHPAGKWKPVQPAGGLGIRGHRGGPVGARPEHPAYQRLHPLRAVGRPTGGR